MLEENPLFHAVAVRLQSPAYWELYCYTDYWIHNMHATDDLILILWQPNFSNL